MTTTPAPTNEQIHAVRRFNRFYTRQIGLLDEGQLQSWFSLTETRVLYELAHRADPTSAVLCRDLGLDAGYLSRVLRGFEAQGLVTRAPSEEDGRVSHLGLTQAGRDAFAPLNERSHALVGALLCRLAPPVRARVVEAMATVERALTAPGDAGAITLRPPRPGDMGWIVHRHGVLYAQEYGWDERFEALVAGIAARFVEDHDPARERCWIAERDGETLGSVFLVRQDDGVAKLRLLLVEPAARGTGLGGRMVNECITFARKAGYARLTLWTNDCLHAARRLYEARGFRLTASEPHCSFGHNLVGETWEVTL